MCGVFGFASKNGKGPDLDRLTAIARDMEQRGPHAFGFAWIDITGRVHSFKQTGRITENLGVLRFAANARLLIGHCRYATHGDPRFNINNHPHPVNGGWLVHNGTIRNHATLIEQYDLLPSSHCDSEVLGLLMEQSPGDCMQRLIRAASLSKTGPMVVLALWPKRMYALRSGNPLYLADAQDAFYLGSLDGRLPAGAFKIRDDSLLEFCVKGDHIKLTAFDVADSFLTTT